MKKRWVFPVSDKRLAWCQERIERYKERGNVVQLPSKLSIEHDIEVLRRNYLNRQSNAVLAKVTPTMFRASAHNVAKALLEEELCGRNPHIKIGVFPWRAGLAFLEPFMSVGLQFPSAIYHLGASRDERTLKTKIYFDDPPDILRLNYFVSDLPIHFYIMDPMLATGNTMLTILKRIFKYKINHQAVGDAMVTIVSMFAAPEGLARVVEEYADIKIVTAAIDDHLNARGYIEPGCGDFGDQHSEGLTISYYEKQRKWFSPRAFQALEERLRNDKQ